MLRWPLSCRKVSVWIWPLKWRNLSTHIGPRDLSSMAFSLTVHSYLTRRTSTWSQLFQCYPGPLHPNDFTRGSAGGLWWGGPVGCPCTSLHLLSLLSLSHLMGFSGLIPHLRIWHRSMKSVFSLLATLLAFHLYSAGVLSQSIPCL